MFNYLFDKFLWLIGCDMKKELDDFEELFPGDCPICAYHNFGLMEGYVSGKVKPHNCNRIDLQKMGDNAGTVAAWNYATGTGPSIKERFEGLYEKCVELETVLRKKGAEGPIWIYGPKEFIDVLSEGSPRWILNADAPHNWLFEYREFQKNRILMGTKSHNYMHYGRIYVANYPVHDVWQADASYDYEVRY